jgi:hypothetical protein
MIAKSTRILTIVSCPRMHDHGAVSAMWTYEDDDPFALTIHPEGTDQFWQVDRLQFGNALISCVPGVPIQVGIASLQMRLSNPYALSLRLTTYTEDGEKYAYLICSVVDVAQFLDDVNKIAPSKIRTAMIDDALAKIFS